MGDDDFLHADEIDSILQGSMRRDRWYTLGEIYGFVEQSATLTPADWLPAAASTSAPRWQRNVRNWLQSRKKSGDVEWRRPAEYRLR